MNIKKNSKFYISNQLNILTDIKTSSMKLLLVSIDFNITLLNYIESDNSLMKKSLLKSIHYLLILIKLNVF